MRRASEGEINFFLRMETEGKHSTKWPWTEGVDTIGRKKVTRWDSSHPCFARLGRCGRKRPIVLEMLKALPMEFAHEVARWFHKRFQG